MPKTRAVLSELPIDRRLQCDHPEYLSALHRAIALAITCRPTRRPATPGMTGPCRAPACSPGKLQRSRPGCRRATAR